MANENEGQAPAQHPAPDAEAARRMLCRHAEALSTSAAGLIAEALRRPNTYVVELYELAARLILYELIDPSRPDSWDLQRAEKLLHHAGEYAEALDGNDSLPAVRHLPALAKVRQLQGREDEARALLARFYAAHDRAGEKVRSLKAPESPPPSEN